MTCCMFVCRMLGIARAEVSDEEMDKRFKSTFCWATVAFDGVHHLSHTHEGSTISAVYYSQTPPGSGDISFDDPRGPRPPFDGPLPHQLTRETMHTTHYILHTTLNTLYTTHYSDFMECIFEHEHAGRLVLPAKAGEMILFPSWIMHEVQAFSQASLAYELLTLEHTCAREISFFFTVLGSDSEVPCVCRVLWFFVAFAFGSRCCCCDREYEGHTRTRARARQIDRQRKTVRKPDSHTEVSQTDRERQVDRQRRQIDLQIDRYERTYGSMHLMTCPVLLLSRCCRRLDIHPEFPSRATCQVKHHLHGSAICYDDPRIP